MKYNCQICKKEFITYNKNQKCCSKKCGGIGLTLKTNIYVNCKNCNNQFTIKKTKLKANKGKFCCKQCYTDYTNKLNIGEVVNAYCKVCGKGFHLTPYLIRMNKQCCSKKCNDELLKKRITKICVCCNKTFETHLNSPKKYCSNNCWHNYLKSNYNKYKCENCGLDFSLPNRKGRKNSKHKFCSNECKFKWHKGKPHPKMSEWLAENIANGSFEPFAGQYYKQGYYISKVTNEKEYYASSYELRRMQQLDDLGVKWTKKHKIKIQYLDQNNLYHYFIPDILLIDYKVIEEIKPTNLLFKNNNQEKFVAAEEYCKENNLTFKVLTESELGI